ncbi:TPA: MoaD/ThiS family protein [Candidatus Micrarchaeota archaeon]|nr:MoaD/ThiS family protein [Candidatus Micrarchaeota archaeon]
MKLVFDNRKKSMRFEGTVTELLKKLGASREEVVIKVNGKLAPETTAVGAKDSVEIIKVVFGG